MDLGEDQQLRVTPKIRFRPTPKRIGIDNNIMDSQTKIAMLDQLKQDARIQQQSQQYKINNSQSQKLSSALPRLGSRDANDNIGRELQAMELQQKVRDLEVLVIDFKGAVERRLQRVQEEQPQRVKELLRSIEERENQLRKQQGERVSQIGDTVQLIKDGNRQQLDQLNAMILDVQRKVEGNDYRLSRLEQQNEGLLMKFNLVNQQGQQVKQLMLTDEMQQNTGSEIDYKLIRDQISQERYNRDQIQDDMLRQYQDLQQRFQRQESEFYQRLKAQRDELIEQNNMTRQQIKGLDQLKLTQLNKDQEYVKALVGSIEGRIQSEMEKRLRSEFQGKSLMEERLQQFRDELKNDEKQILQGEQKLARGVHESISSLHQIIKNTREQLEAQAAASQAIVTENLKALSKSVDTIREATTMRVQLIEHSQMELNQRFSETRQMLHDHQNIIAEALQSEQQKLEQLQNQIQDEVRAQMVQNREVIVQYKKDGDQWQFNFEQKNLLILTEISGALKQMKQDNRTERKGNIERMDQLRRDFDEFNKTQVNLQNNLEGHMQQVVKQLQFQGEELRMYLKDAMENNKKQQRVDLEQANQKVYEKGMEFTQQMCSQIKQQLEQEWQQSSVKLEQSIRDGVIESEMRMQVYFNEQQQFVQNQIEELKQLQLHQINELMKLLNEYADVIKNFRQEMKNEQLELNKTIQQMIKLAREQLEAEIRQQIAEQTRLLQENLLNVELKVNKKVDDSIQQQQQQIDALKIYIDRVEMALKSYLLQQIEEMKFEVRSQLKDMENEIFKIKAWLLKQIELINNQLNQEKINIESTILNFQQAFDQRLEDTQKNLDDRLQLQDKYRIDLEEQIIKKNDEFSNDIQELRDSIKQQNESLNEQMKQIEAANDNNLKALQNGMEENQKSQDQKSAQQLKEMNDQFQAMSDKFQETKDILEKLDQDIKQTSIGQIQQIENQVQDIKIDFNAKFQLMQSYLNSFEAANAQNQRNDQKSNIAMITDQGKLLIQNQQVMEQNFQNALESELGKIIKWQNDFNQSLEEILTQFPKQSEIQKQKNLSDKQNQLIQDQKIVQDKLISDYNKLMVDISSVIEKLNNDHVALSQETLKFKADVQKDFKIVNDKFKLQDEQKQSKTKNKNPPNENQIQSIDKQSIDEIKEMLNTDIQKINDKINILEQQITKQKEKPIKKQPAQQQNDENQNLINQQGMNDLQQDQHQIKEQLQEMFAKIEQLENQYKSKQNPPNENNQISRKQTLDNQQLDEKQNDAISNLKQEIQVLNNEYQNLQTQLQKFSALQQDIDDITLGMNQLHEDIQKQAPQVQELMTKVDHLETQMKDIPISKQSKDKSDKQQTIQTLTKQVQDLTADSKKIQGLQQEIEDLTDGLNQLHERLQKLEPQDQNQE